jgi:glycosyltransferase involved in cell wall biosynthesis
VRVLFISTRYAGGGAERSARELLQGIATAAGASVAMIVSARAGDEPDFVRGARLPGERALRILEKLRPPQVDWIHLGARLALGRATPDRYDLVHVHNVHGGWMSLKALSRLCRRLPCVWTLHDEWGPSAGVAYDLSGVGGKYGAQIRAMPGADVLFPDTLVSQRFRRVFDRWSPQPQTIISPSQYIKQLAERSGRFPGAEVVNLPYGVRTPQMAESTAAQAEARRRFDLAPEDRVVLLMAAHLGSPVKGISPAVDALRTLRPDAFKLLVVGGGGDFIARHVPQRVVETGYLHDDRALVQAYRVADLTLIPSVADNFPYVGLESMACERPIVSFRIGGLAEMVGDADERGLAAEPFDVAELGRHVMTLLGAPDLRSRLGAAGRRWVSDRCDVDQWIRTHLDLYRRAIAAFHSGSATHAVAAARPTEAVR